MKPAQRRPQARIDIAEIARHYREAAGPKTAQKFVAAVKEAISLLEANPAIGSPRIGQLIDVPVLRTWRVTGFPAMVWYVDRMDHVDVVRVIGERQDANVVALPEA